MADVHVAVIYYSATGSVHALARAAAESAETAWKQRDAVARKLESNLERKRAQHEHHLSRLAEARAAVAESPGVDALRRSLAELARLQKHLDQATAAVRAAR